MTSFVVLQAELDSLTKSLNRDTSHNLEVMGLKIAHKIDKLDMRMQWWMLGGIVAIVGANFMCRGK